MVTRVSWWAAAGMIWGGLLAGGCTHYEYELVQPQEFARHIGADSPVVVKIDPVEYHLQAADNHLVIGIYNTSNEPLLLSGDQSVVVDPGGRSHRLPRDVIGTIAPSSHKKLILPPIRPVYPSGPTLGIGFGASYGRRFDSEFGDVYDPYYDPSGRGPRYYGAYDDAGDAGVYWTWEGESEVRLMLVFQRGDKTLPPQQFVFRQRKM